MRIVNDLIYCQGAIIKSTGPEGAFKDRRRERSRCFSCPFIFFTILSEHNKLSAKISVKFIISGIYPVHPLIRLEMHIAV